ncbi:MAG: hypothetical protein E6J02_04615 [Chloroflexi bacterium]|nr:MAG: hypothetical protein E6J02_04615 [Chloroflexota bacterium]TME17132.1 MAG: hypothetical protein E6I63_04155 [Chloroflexota bacterium]
MGSNPPIVGWSADGLWFWDGLSWNDAISPDGHFRYDGRGWQPFGGLRSPMPAGAFGQPPAPPLPVSAGWVPPAPEIAAAAPAPPPGPIGPGAPSISPPPNPLEAVLPPAAPLAPLSPPSSAPDPAQDDLPSWLDPREAERIRIERRASAAAVAAAAAAPPRGSAPEIDWTAMRSNYRYSPTAEAPAASWQTGPISAVIYFVLLLFCPIACILFVLRGARWSSTPRAIALGAAVTLWGLGIVLRVTSAILTSGQ